jgi:predicted RecA/RadA family phage recombinase
MAKNFIQNGNTVTLTAPAAVKSGDLIVVGALAGVCAYDADSGAEVEVSLTGVWELPKAAPGAINEGAIVWFDNTTNHNVVNASATGMFPIGVAVRAAGSSDTTCRVRLSGIPVAAVA